MILSGLKTWLETGQELTTPGSLMYASPTTGDQRMTALDHTFTGTLEQSSATGGWTYLCTDWSAEFFGTRGLVKVGRVGRRAPVPGLVHGARRRHPQAADQGRPADRRLGKAAGDTGHRAPRPSASTADWRQRPDEPHPERRPLRRRPGPRPGRRPLLLRRHGSASSSPRRADHRDPALDRGRSTGRRPPSLGPGRRPGRTRAGVDTGVRFAVGDATTEHRTMADHGVSVGELLAWPDVPPMFTFDDPDGNRFYVVASD
jgi:hypothetical protein